MKKGWLLIPAALLLAACGTLFGPDDDPDEGALFTMNNAASANYVIVFARGGNGRLTRVDSVATGGRGSGPHPVFGTDPLESQDAVILADRDRYLFVVNAGSSEVTSFRVRRSGRLVRVSTVSSGGQFPVSLAAYGDVLYVVNANAGGNISGFRIGSGGLLAPLAGSTRPLSGAAAPQPGSIRISTDGRLIVVTEKATNRLVLYELGEDRLPGPAPTIVASPGPTPFGAEFDGSGRYILSLANVGPGRAAVPDGSSVASLAFPSTGGATVLSGPVPTTETAACWIEITPNGRWVYTTNTASGTITGFEIGPGGALTRVTPDGRTAVTGPGTDPLEMAFAGRYLYALTAGDRGIHAFRVERDGSLTPRPEVDVAGMFPESVTGLAAF